MSATEEKKTGWREYVHASEFMPSHLATFLDEVEGQPGVTITRAGLINISKPIPIGMIPYELCPTRVKKLLRGITAEGELPQELFNDKQKYKNALCNLHIYGYLADIPKTLLERRRYVKLLKERWLGKHPEKVQEYKRNAEKFTLKYQTKRLRI